MKILVLQDWLRSGGTERQSILLANAFARAGHASHLLTFRPDGTLAGGVDAAVQRTSLQPFDLHLDWFAPGLHSALTRTAPDIVLCMGRMANCRGADAQRTLPNAAVVATMRTGKPLPAPFRRSLQEVTHVVANSADAKARLQSEYGVSPERIAVIHNSLVFPPETALVRNEELRRKFGATPDTTVLLSVAMFRPEKNQRELIEIAAALPAAPPCQLWLAGDGPTRAACEQLVAARGLGDRVRFLGFHRDPTPLYVAADVAVHASASESLSNFLIEAQAHGLPAVAYAAQGIGECFIPNQTGWIIPAGNRPAFVAHLSPLVASPALRQACAAPARAYARGNFDADRQVHAYLDLFQRLVDARRRT